ncbi:MAG: response regulator [Lachnospiraceae bacterium]|jgi:signal transduction histidine kinase/CheY-like chemotaxis protein/HPt (histidine-containing phosphotransfer) domain-containing protein|nr:response regulator [Lachnospiraceae bacterium]
MRTRGQTSIHLLLASIVTMFGVMLIVIIIALSWEPWMVPVILIGNTLVWCLHIGRAGSDTFYENLCFGLLMVGFFFFGVHKITLFDIPAVACMIILVFSMFHKKRLLYMTAALYVLELMYHLFILHTITFDMGTQNIVRLGLGATVVAGAMAIAIYRIKRRLEAKRKFDSTVKELETAGRQNAEFLSNVSHELRTPINMVLGISEVILEKGISPEIRADMHSIQLAGKRLSNLISNMLDYTEIVEGTLTPAKEPYRITSVLNDIITMTAMQSSKQQLEMVFDLDPKMPSVLIGDMEKISHVLKILLENSIKFTEEGGIDVCIEFRPESYGINLIIDICDTGIGMTASQITQMCDDFYQADSGSNRFAGGLGLGLPIARGLLHAMGGFMHFSSSEQQGLKVQITIPQGVADYTPSMILSHPESLCIACYFRPEKYSSDEVRRYYDKMIFHMVKGLGIEGYQAHNFDGLLKIHNSHTLTHVFITQSEYEENIPYYEELADTLQVVVIAEREFLLNKNSRLLVIHKPFSALSVVNLLNGEVNANGFEEAQAAGRKPFSCEGVRVLAVDDEEMNLVVAKGVLGSYGIQVDTCLSGREAVERCANTSYDIVFLDHMMPGFDGVETLKQIREIKNGIYQELPIIALTANTISGAREMFRNEGFTEFIPKPIERAVLERVLRKVLPGHQVQYDEAPVSCEDLPKRAASPSIPSSLNGAKKQKKKKKKKFQKENIPKDVLPETSVPDKNYQEQENIQETKIPESSSSQESLPETEISESISPQESLPKAEISEGFLPEEPVLEAESSKSYSSTDSYTDQEEEDTDDSPIPYPYLVRIGINVQLGLDYCCGEEDFYLEMLRMFCSQAEEKRAEIVALYDAANWADYTVKVHALKSTSLTIGAERLAEQAKLLEQAGKNGNTEYIYHSHPILLNLYDEICDTIAGL